MTEPLHDMPDRQVDLKQLTAHQRQIWKMRYRYGWRLSRIALELGRSPSTICRILQQARLRAGVPRGRDVSVIRTKPRAIRVRHLSDCHNY